MKNSVNKRDLSILIGNCLDHFDTALYGFLVPILSHVFFPAGDEIVNLILGYSILATSLFTRPIGSYLFGIIAKKYGGIRALSYSLVGVAITTLLIGFIPSYQKIGWFAPLILIVIRMIQGIFAEGESSIARLYILEDKNETKAFRASYFYQVSTMAGIILASFVSSILISLGHHEYWRLCFVAGGSAGFIGYFLRKYSTQSKEKITIVKSVEFNYTERGAKPIYNRRVTSDNVSEFKSFGYIYPDLPNIKLIWVNRLNIIRVSLVMGFSYLTYSIPFIFMNSFIPLINTISLTKMMKYNNILLAIDMLMIPLIGCLVQKLPYKSVMFASLLIMGITIIPLWINLENASLLYVNFVRLWIITCGVVFLCPMNLWLNDLFKNSNKYLLIGMGNALGSSIIGRLTPSFCLLLWNLTHSSLSIAIYISAITFAAIWAVCNKTHKSSSH